MDTRRRSAEAGKVAPGGGAPLTGGTAGTASRAGGRVAGQASPALAVDARRLVKAFGTRRALDGVSLQVPVGSFLSIFGPNGAGKTTLLRILATLSRPTGGSLSMLGVDALEDPESLRSRIGLISHRSMVYGDLTARENLELFARLYGMPDPAGRARELLGLVELDHRANDAARTFSRGMTQRLSIARALVNDPGLVLLDEPYAGLDPHAVRLFDELIARVRDGRTFVMVSHDLEKGFSLATHDLILARGRVVAFGTRDEFTEEGFRETYLATVGMGVA